MTQRRNVLFFDGVCNLCNHFVDFLIRNQKTNKVFFASLQGKTAQMILSKEYNSNLNTVVYQRNEKTLIKSQAALYVMIDILKWGSLFRIFLILPTPICDFFYDFIARNRYKIWGHRNSCRIPTAEEQSYFLD